MKKPYETVLELNDQLYERTKRDDVWFSHTSNGFSEAISFHILGENYDLKFDLWNSENSQQEYREATDDYEPLEDTIKRELALIMVDLNLITKKLCK